MSEIRINENGLKENPSFLKRLLNAFLGIVYTAILIQVMLFAFKSYTSILLLYNQWWFTGLLLFGGIFGFIFGDQFHGWLRNKMEEWNIWSF